MTEPEKKFRWRRRRRRDCEPLCQARTVEELNRQNVQTIARMQEYSHRTRTVGDRVADGFARVVGSWTFLIVQSVLLALWIVLNIMAWWRHWDPYPFILLNLALSFQAAYATPIIMMSQNREARMAERRNQLDLQINLLAEQETTEILRLLRRLCEHHNIPMDDRAAIDLLTQKTKPEKLVEEIEKQAR
ncbi:MAG TPA: DUF1003 domain-containing protein [Tepidisphaeraceae bacterium]|jgi:uncharacterized membrane protein